MARVPPGLRVRGGRRVTHDIQNMLNPSFEREKIATLDTVPAYARRRRLRLHARADRAEQHQEHRLRQRRRPVARARPAAPRLLLPQLRALPALGRCASSAPWCARCGRRTPRQFSAAQFSPCTWYLRGATATALPGTTSRCRRTSCCRRACTRRARGTDRREDPMDFLAWLLNALHTALGGRRRRARRSSTPPSRYRQDAQQHAAAFDEAQRRQAPPERRATRTVPFLYLTVDVPAAALQGRARRSSRAHQV